MQSIFRANGLTIVLLLLFLLSFAGHSLAGHSRFNQDQLEHNRSPIRYSQYLGSGAFIESVFENWESEFLQMALYVWLTSFLFQRGSAESKDPDKKEEADENPRNHRNDPNAPAPVRAGGVILKLYERSLSLSLMLLFFVSFVLHLTGSTRETCREQTFRGQPCPTMSEQLYSATFWFESLQNWQSEFLSIAVLVVFSIFLRQRGSPESKPVHAAHSETGR
jgi:hypothetical protein